MSVPLARHNLVRTRDVDEARSEVARQFCAHDLTRVDRSGALDVVHNGYRLGSVGLNYLRYGAEVRIRPVPFDSFWLVQIPLTGRAVIGTDGQVVHSDPRVASMPSPDVPADMSWGPANEQLIVYLDRAAVQRHSSRRDEPDLDLAFEPTVHLGAPRLQSWLRLIGYVRGEIDAGSELLDTPLISSQLEDLIITGLLAGQPNSASTEPCVRYGPATSRTVRQATALIEESPEHPWRVEELARAVGVSARTLQENFQHDSGQSPLQVLRRVRLHRAHDELVGSDQRVTSVTEVAVRWGFGHLGRFSTSYRSLFAESPSQTLARG
ncbi:AraC family transcriptional regulator [Microlunatus aurantiacus]|uniref:AraC family transcriptional regulator n=1 Tax=Microlunatus aurantiacus TaxID=446786 RepID=A0ABP7E5B2_9ACTN